MSSITSNPSFGWRSLLIGTQKEHERKAESGERHGKRPSRKPDLGFEDPRLLVKVQ